MRADGGEQSSDGCAIREPPSNKPFIETVSFVSECPCALATGTVLFAPGTRTANALRKNLTKTDCSTASAISGMKPDACSANIGWSTAQESNAPGMTTGNFKWKSRRFAASSLVETESGCE